MASSDSDDDKLSIASFHPDDDDKLSIASSTSSTKAPIGCPFCSWNKQSRYLFNHILTSHKKELFGCLVGKEEEIKTNLEEGNLLELLQTITIYKPDDYKKEYPENRDFHIYGCLGCKGSYQMDYKAQSHWKNSKKCHKEHTKQVKQLLDKIDKNKRNKKSWFEELTEKELNIGLERFRRWYYRIINLDIPLLKEQPLNLGKDIAVRYLNFEFKTEFENLKDKLDTYLLYTDFIHKFNLHINKTFYTDYPLPNPFALQDTFLEEGLPAVGTSFTRNPAEEKQAERDRIAKLIDEQSNHLALKLEEERRKIRMEFEKKPAPSVELTTIQEEPVIPVKVKRNSFTIPIPATGSLVNHQPVLQFPVSISNTKVKRAPKTVPK